jgi:hypothetical protein
MHAVCDGRAAEMWPRIPFGRWNAVLFFSYFYFPFLLLSSVDRRLLDSSGSSRLCAASLDGPTGLCQVPPPPVIPLPSRHYIIQRRTATLDQKNVSICVCVCVLLPGEAKEFPTPGEYLKKRPGETGVVGRLERAKPAARVSIYHREKHKERERGTCKSTHT